MGKDFLKKDAALSKHSDKNKIKCVQRLQTEPKMDYLQFELSEICWPGSAVIQSSPTNQQSLGNISQETFSQQHYQEFV